MNNRQSLSSHLAALQQARAAAFANGEWQRVEVLQLCIDDTRKALAVIADHNTSRYVYNNYNTEFQGARPVKAGEDY